MSQNVAHPGAGEPSLHVVVHGHFYQPPRELPDTDTLPEELSAAPFHDWNQRIHEECYRAVVSARLLDAEGRVGRFVNTLEGMSFDAAPTLLRWLEREAPATYRGFLEADAASVRRLGHGNALATSYHHVILPLASPKDRRTEIRWGLQDFRRRFRREPEGFWLPEAAVDLATLDDLAAAGLRFVVLGEGQVRDLPPAGMPGRVALARGRSLAVFVYDGALSHGVSFGALIQDARVWGDAVLAHRTPGGPSVVSMATDGETFGHHHTFGEMALAGVLERLGREPGVQVSNFAAVLARWPATHALRIVEPSSWSCPHGVDRWYRDCGCGAADESTGGNQGWRTPLHEGLASLGAGIRAHYQERAAALFPDPRETLGRFGEVLEADAGPRIAFVEAEAGRGLEPRERLEALEALEMQRAALSMMTSCARFFDDLDRVEPRIALRSAGRALALVRDVGLRGHLTERLLETLAGARSAEGTDGRALWREVVSEVPAAPLRVAAAVVLARQGGLTPPARVGPWSVDDAGDALGLVDERTTRTLRVPLPLDSGPVPPRRLPHPWDVRVADALAAGPLRIWLAPHEVRAVLAGRWTLDAARAHALVRALDDLPAHRPGDGPASVVWMAAWIGELARGPGVPAPLQSALWRAWRRAPATLAQQLSPLLPVAGLAPPDPSGPFSPSGPEA